MADSNHSSKLREYLRKRDRGLGDRANAFWENSRDIQDRQTPPDANKGGYQHVIQVENNIWRLLTETKKAREFKPIEWFLLSCAACSHDFDKGLKSARPKGAHGVASGRFVYEHRKELGVDTTEAIAVDYLDSIHDYRGTQFEEELEQLPEKYGTKGGPIDLRRLGVVLKVGDTLQTDQTRVSDIAVDVEKLTPMARSKHLGRAAISGWHIDGSRVILEAYPESPEQRQSVQTAFEFLREDEWSAISRELRVYRLPHEIELKLHDRYLRSDSEPVGTSTSALQDPGTVMVPRMDHYRCEDAPFFAGRDDDRMAIEQLVYGYRECKLVGPSGVGKSSLLHAALQPAISSLAGWRMLITRPDKTGGRFFTVSDFFPSASDEALPSFGDACGHVIGDARDLVVVLDQFEDVAYFGTVDAQAIAGEIIEAQKAVSPRMLHVVFACRDDVESLLGDVWQQLTGSSRGLPTHHLKRLGREGARSAIEKLLEKMQLKLEPHEPLLNMILDDLVAASQRESGLSGEVVYPPFIQMVMDRIFDLAAAGKVNAQDYEALARSTESAGDVAIGEYLKRTVVGLEVKGEKAGVAKMAKAVLACLARSSGKKGAADESRVAAETGLDKDKLAALLHEMARQRLVRRLGSGGWEIIHDFLARRVMDSWVSDDERRFKHVRESLEARAATIDVHHGFLTRPELRDLWLYRDRVPPPSLSDRERLVILVSLYAPSVGNRSVPSDFSTHTGAPGWFWLCDLMPASFVKLLTDCDQIRHPIYTFLEKRLLAQVLDACGLSQLLDLTKGTVREAVRVAAVEAIGNRRAADVLPLLRDLAKDGSGGVRQAALEATIDLATPDALPFLRELAKDGDDDVRYIAVEAIGEQGTPDDLPLLRDLAKNNDEVRAEAVKAIGMHGTAEDVALLRELAGHSDVPVRQAVADAIGQLGTSDALPLLVDLAKDSDLEVSNTALRWIRELRTPDNLPLLRNLVAVGDEDVCFAAADAIGKLGAPDDLPLLLGLAEHSVQVFHGMAAEAIVNLARRGGLSLLRDLATGDNEDVRREAVEAIVNLATADALNLLRDLAKCEHGDVRYKAVEAIGKQGTPDDLPFLRDLVKDTDEVGVAAVEAIGEQGTPDDFPFLRDLCKDSDENICLATVSAIGKLRTVEALPLLCDLGKSDKSGLRSVAVNAIGEMATAGALPFLRDLSKDGYVDVRKAAVELIGKQGTADSFPLLRSLAQDGEVDVRQAAAKAIGGMHARGLPGEPLASLRDFLLDVHPRVSSAAAAFVGRLGKRETILRFLADHQHEMTTEALGTLDWYLHAPAFLREAQQREQDE